MPVQLSLPVLQPTALSSTPCATQYNTMGEDAKGLTFIDLFAGIGGFHQALSQAGMICVFASEIDEHARKTYLTNHNLDPALFNQDIRTLSPYEVPDHDILCAGFPCQPFSQAGYKKGFTDGDKSERGNLFFCILDILEAKRPKAFILENVRHLLNHDDGNTFATIYQHLTNLDYAVYYKVLKASDYGRPQHRPRIYIVGFDKQQINTNYAFNFPSPIPLKATLSDVWEGQCDRTIGFTLRVGGRGSGLHDRRNWDTYLVDGDVRRLGVKQGVKQGVKLMGFPDTFQFPVTPTQAMKQLGNSVCVDVVNAIAKQVSNYVNNHSYGDDAETISVKSHLGSPPTLLNASSATNFIFKIDGLNPTMDSVEQMGSSKNKVQDYIKHLKTQGATFTFLKCENANYEANLRKIDTCMPEMLANLLLKYYQGEGARLSSLVITEQEQCRFKDYLRAVLLGMFPTKAWDGNLSANGALIIDKQGDRVLYHVIKESYLKEYLFSHVKLDTPSTTRHRFGSLYTEGNQHYFKLNLQLRLMP
jgi:site-specific DNA-cytosine methylase